MSDKKTRAMPTQGGSYVRNGDKLDCKHQTQAASPQQLREQAERAAKEAKQNALQKAGAAPVKQGNNTQEDANNAG